MSFKAKSKFEIQARQFSRRFSYKGLFAIYDTIAPFDDTMKRKKFFESFVACVFLLSPSLAYAVGSAGFENASFSADSLAQGNAVVAQADEPAAISYNPAGIVDLPGLQIQSNLNFISAITHHSIGGNGMRSSGTITPVPTGYVTLNPGPLLGDRVAFGIGSDFPFGTANKYDSTHPAVIYAGWRNWLYMYTVKPVMAVKITDRWSIGAGPMYYRIYDYGGIQAYPNKLVTPTLTDGQIRLNLAGNSWGWHAGTLLELHARHHLGFYFRSPVTVLIKGLGKVERSASGNFETGAWAKLDLPLNFTWAYAFWPTDKWVVEMDFGFTRWSARKRVNIEHDSVNATEDTIINAIGRADKNDKDSFSLHLGTSYKVNDRFTLRAGGLFYTEAVHKNHFIPAVADSDRLGYAAGFSYKLGKHFDFDVSYLHMFLLRREIDNTIGEALGGRGDGEWRTFIQELTVGLTYHWDDLFEKHFSKKKEESLPAIDASRVIVTR